MEAAIEEARKGARAGGIPIGSVLVKDGEIVARGHNKRVQELDPVLHAEIDCLRNGGRVGSYRDTILYSTLMPCYLCAGAVVQECRGALNGTLAAGATGRSPATTAPTTCSEHTLKAPAACCSRSRAEYQCELIVYLYCYMGMHNKVFVFDERR